MVEIKILGMASGQTAEYEPVSFIINGANRKLLVETGPSVIRQLERCAFRPGSIDAVLISHSHADHCLGYPYFMFNYHIDRISGRTDRERIPVLSTKSVYEGLLSMVRFCYPPGEFPTFKVEEITLTPGNITELYGSLKISSADVLHSVPTIAISILVDGKKITYSSDTTYSEALVRLASKSDLLIQEAFCSSERAVQASRIKHATATEAGKIAKESNSKMMVLVHLDPAYISRKEELISEAKKEFDGEIIVPKELQELSL